MSKEELKKQSESDAKLLELKTALDASKKLLSKGYEDTTPDEWREKGKEAKTG